MNDGLLALIPCVTVVLVLVLVCFRETNERLGEVLTAILVILLVYLVLMYG